MHEHEEDEDDAGAKIDIDKLSIHCQIGSVDKE
jgi:hypothetical protein